LLYRTVKVGTYVHNGVRTGVSIKFTELTNEITTFFLLGRTSVADSDTYVFGPPGSRSGFGSFYHQAKIVRKTLHSCCCATSS
jgi:hypothetical protein